jgi:predicted ribosome quality control (RQC) complex YloA/Tae2 family protein
MAFDSTVLAAVVAELSERLTGGRISKIYQPIVDEIALLIYAGGANHRLLLSANARFARLHLSRIEKKNPQAPPTFCMLLRKYIEGGRILSIQQVGRDRICRLQIGVTDELGNPAEFTLVAELMGKHSNIMLLSPQERIVDAIRRVTEEVNRHRELLPGLRYVAPPVVDKVEPTSLTAADLVAAAPPDDLTAWQWLLQTVDGLGPLLAKEAVSRAGYPVDSLAHNASPEALATGVREVAGLTASDPCLLYDAKGRLKDFHVVRLIHWPGQIRSDFAGVSPCLEAFYGQREEDDRVSALRGSLSKLVRDEAARARRKVQLQGESLRTAENAEEFRILGELITANLWQIQKGATEAVVPNYYETEGTQIQIPLDPALGPAENAQAYYRRYQKAKSGRTIIQEQIARSRTEQAYLEQVEASLAEAGSMPDLEEIRTELQAEGYLGAKKERKSGKGAGPGGSRDERPAPPLTVHSTDGLEIWVGRNNRQNDYLTMKLAAPHDLWFHTKEIAGSHVILRVPPGREVPERAVHEAAALAAWHSRARDSSSVPVDYTVRKHVRKPSGARPGMVIYEHQKTLWVTPDPALNPILQQVSGGGANGTGGAADSDRAGDSRAD